MNRSFQKSVAGPATEGFRFGPVVGLLAACVALVGCTTPNYRSAAPAAEPSPVNVYTSAPALPIDVKRVAVLPLVADARYADLTEGCEALDPVLNAELIRTRKFEVVRVTPEDLKNCTGQIGWTGEEALPRDFFSSLQSAYGCDAVLFCQLTEFRPYAPLAVGWRMKLVNVHTGQILWAGDELYDAGRDAALTERAYRYWFFPPSARTAAEDWVMDNSPRHLARYTVEKLFATLPDR